MKSSAAICYYRRNAMDDVKIGTHPDSLPLIKIKVCFLRLVLCKIRLPSLLFQFAIVFFFWVYKNWVAFVLTGIALRISIWNFVVILSLYAFFVKVHKDTVIFYLILICACGKLNEHSDKWDHSWKLYFTIEESSKNCAAYFQFMHSRQ